MNGDNEAFEEWMQPLLNRVECFAIQYGVSPQDAATVAETVFKNIYQKRHALIIEQLHEHDVFRRTLKLLAEFQLKTMEDKLFLFEEDDELHNRVIALAKDWRVPFILSRFQKKSATDIAKILKLTVGEVETVLAEAIQLLKEPNLEKKLEFLQTSYSRLPSLCKEDCIYMQENSETSPVQEKTIIKSKRKPIYLWGVGTAILLALLFVSVTKSEAFQKSSSEKFIEKTEIAFEKELDNYYEQLGLKKQDVERYNLHFPVMINLTNITNFITELKTEVKMDGKIDKKKARLEYSALIDDLKLPSEMMDELISKSLAKDQKQSLKFVGELIEKTDLLSYLYIYVLQDYPEVFANTEWIEDGDIDIDSFIANESNIPETVQNALQGMLTQGLTLYWEPNHNFLYSLHGNEALMIALQEKLHPSVNSYLRLFMNGVEGIDLTIDEQVDILFTFESDLLNRDLDLNWNLQMMIKGTYTWMLYSIIGIDTETLSYDSEGILKPEYKDAWIRIASNGNNSPASNLMNPIVQKMEDNDWTISSVQNELSFTAIYEAISTEITERQEKNK